MVRIPTVGHGRIVSGTMRRMGMPRGRRMLLAAMVVAEGIGELVSDEHGHRNAHGVPLGGLILAVVVLSVVVVATSVTVLRVVGTVGLVAATVGATAMFLQRNANRDEP